MKLKAVVAVVTLMIASSAASAGPVAWSVSIGGVGGNVGFGVGVASVAPVPPPPPVCVGPPVVFAPPPVCVAPIVVPRYHRRMRPPMYAPPVFVQAPPCVAVPVVMAPPRVVFAQPPVFRICR
jgi:hypothetical protein